MPPARAEPPPTKETYQFSYSGATERRAAAEAQMRQRMWRLGRRRGAQDRAAGQPASGKGTLAPMLSWRLPVSASGPQSCYEHCGPRATGKSGRRCSQEARELTRTPCGHCARAVGEGGRGGRRVVVGRVSPDGRTSAIVVRRTIEAGRPVALDRPDDGRGLLSGAVRGLGDGRSLPSSVRASAGRRAPPPGLAHGRH